MRKVLILLFLISHAFYTTLYGQQQSSVEQSYSLQDNRSSELSVNVSFFIKEFLSLNNTELANQLPYLINFKYFFGKAGLRTGIGFDYVNSTTIDLNDIQFTERSHSIDYRIGAELKSRIANRWIINYGADVIYHRNKSIVITDNGFDVTTDTERTNGWGGGPFAGIVFMISNRIRIYTESSIYFLHSNTIDETKFESFPEFNLEATSNEDELDLNLPTTIFFAVTF